jgi:hypothetical protein
VYWPFQWGNKVGLLVGGGILVIGIVQLIVGLARR